MAVPLFAFRISFCCKQKKPSWRFPMEYLQRKIQEASKEVRGTWKTIGETYWGHGEERRDWKQREWRSHEKLLHGVCLSSKSLYFKAIRIEIYASISFLVIILSLSSFIPQLISYFFEQPSQIAWKKKKKKSHNPLVAQAWLWTNTKKTHRPSYMSSPTKNQSRQETNLIATVEIYDKRK